MGSNAPSRIEKFPEDSVELADLHFTYGKALLENAIANSGVLGKAEPEGEKEDEGACPLSSQARLADPIIPQRPPPGKAAPSFRFPATAKTRTAL